MHIEWFETLVEVEREREQSLHFPSIFTTLSHPTVLTSSSTLRHQQPQHSKQAKDKEKQSERSVTSNKFGN
jgi:hypothetical protein